MGRGMGVKKPQEAQKAKALWKMKAAKDAGEEYNDPMREDNIRGPIVALDKALKCVENPHQRSRPEFSVEVSRGGGRWLPPKFVGKIDLGGRLALLGSDG